MILGFVFALLANRVARGRWFFRLAFFAPYILPSAVVALIWMWLYTPALGLLDTALAKVGMTAPSWLGDAAWAMLVAGHHHRLVDARLQLHPLPRRPPGDTA